MPEIENVDDTEDMHYMQFENTIEDNEDIIHVHPEFVKEIKSLSLPDYAKFKLADEEMKASIFCKVHCNSKEFILSKSSLLWLLSTDVNKLSNDRGKRFLSEKINNNVTVVVESYYAVFYDESWYIGRILQQIGNEWKIKFLKKNLLDYVWPRSDDIQIVKKCFIFYGPIKMLGNLPFQIISYNFQNKKQTIFNETKVVPLPWATNKIL